MGAVWFWILVLGSCLGQETKLTTFTPTHFDLSTRYTHLKIDEEFRLALAAPLFDVTVPLEHALRRDEIVKNATKLLGSKQSSAVYNPFPPIISIFRFGIQLHTLEFATVDFVVEDPSARDLLHRLLDSLEVHLFHYPADYALWYTKVTAEYVLGSSRTATRAWKRANSILFKAVRELTDTHPNSPCVQPHLFAFNSTMGGYRTVEDVETLNWAITSSESVLIKARSPQCSLFAELLVELGFYLSSTYMSLAVLTPDRLSNEEALSRPRAMSTPVEIKDWKVETDTRSQMNETEQRREDLTSSSEELMAAVRVAQSASRWTHVGLGSIDIESIVSPFFFTTLTWVRHLFQQIGYIITERCPWLVLPESVFSSRGKGNKVELNGHIVSEDDPKSAVSMFRWPLWLQDRSVDFSNTTIVQERVEESNSSCPSSEGYELLPIFHGLWDVLDINLENMSSGHTGSSTDELPRANERTYRTLDALAFEGGLNAEIAAQHGDNSTFLESDFAIIAGPQFQQLQTKGLLIHHEGGAAVEGGRNVVDLNSLRRRGADQLRLNGSVLVIDDVFTPEGLAALRNYSDKSTVFNTKKLNGYSCAFFVNGFLSPLIGQVTFELQEALPNIICGHHLVNAWAYKYSDGESPGINIHSDIAAVNINCWTTEPDAHSDLSSGGMTIWKNTPLWKSSASNDFSPGKVEVEYGKTPRLVQQSGVPKGKTGNSINGFLASSRPEDVIKVGYRVNRCVIFDSYMMHKTDPIRFGRGLKRRRVNYTFLFGLMGGTCQQAFAHEEKRKRFETLYERERTNRD